MVPHTRRSLLRRAGCLLAVPLAGCADSSSSSRSEPPSLDDDDVITDVAVLTRRIEEVESPPKEPIVHYPEEDDDSPEYDGSSDAPRPQLPYVIADEHVDELEFRRELPGEEGAKQFLRETDYDESTVFLVEHDVSACHRFALQYVEIRSSNRLAPQFCRVMRDPSVECSVEERHREVTFVRVPMAYDSPPPGSGLGHSSSCDLPPDHPARNATRTRGDDR
ncbi:MAG: hypothetical protein V5A46_07280 [Haloferacaceae archaeon]